MKKICIIGNSHVASLKSAWDRIYGDYHDVSITFYAQRSVGLKDLIVDNGRLMPGTDALRDALRFTSDGHEYIDVKQFDHVLLYGLGVFAPIVSPDIFYSEALIETLLSKGFDGSLGFKILNKIRKISSQKVFIGHVPLKKAIESDVNDISAYCNGIDIANRLRLGSVNAELLRQPEITIINGNATHPKYSTGSMVLSIGDKHDGKTHSSTDDGHMNSVFGELWLKDFLSLTVR
jgi:hypothetical protein